MSKQQEKQFLAALEQQFTQHYSNRLSKADNSIQENSRCLAELAAKISIIEALLLEEREIKVTDNIELLASTLHLDAENFAPNDNLLDLEFHNGKAFHWTGEDPRIDFPLLISREEEKSVTISIVAVVKSEYIQQLSIFADGMPLKFVAKDEEGVIKLVATLPAELGKKTATMLSVLLPDTASPAELGTSTDTRKMGIAIQSISVGKAVKKRFKFGK